MRNSTMQSILDEFFHDDLLKAMLAYPLFGNGGLPPSRMSAMIGAKIFQEFLLDGGYYPEGGMQAIADALSSCFRKAGGDLRLSSRVEKISKQGDVADGIIIEKQGFIPSRLVISNCDTYQTFIQMLEGEKISEEFANNIKKMVPSISMVILYIALKQSFTALPEPGINMWFLASHNIDMVYSLAMSGSPDCLVMLRKMPGAHGILAYVPAAFIRKNYWSEQKTAFIEKLIGKIENYLIPELSAHIIYKGAATPQTLYEYTSNFQGAAYGWASTPSQIAVPYFKTQQFIKNLYCVGHWTTHGLGIPGVVHIARDVAEYVQKKWKSLHNSMVK